MSSSPIEYQLDEIVEEALDLFMGQERRWQIDVNGCSGVDQYHCRGVKARLEEAVRRSEFKVTSKSHTEITVKRVS